MKKNLELSYAYHLADYVFWQSNFCKKTSEKFLGKRIGEGEILYNVGKKGFKMAEENNENLSDNTISESVNKPKQTLSRNQKPLKSQGDSVGFIKYFYIKSIFYIIFYNNI